METTTWVRITEEGHNTPLYNERNLEQISQFLDDSEMTPHPNNESVFIFDKGTKLKGPDGESLEITDLYTTVTDYNRLYPKCDKLEIHMHITVRLV